MFASLFSKISPPALIALIALSAQLLCGCVLAPEQARQVDTPTQATENAWAADFTDLRSKAEGEVLWPLDADASTLSIHVFRAGRAAKLGHNHVLTAPKLKGLVRLSPNEFDLESVGFELALRLDELLLDAPAARAALGAAWASTPSAEMIAATRANMLGQAGLRAETFPLLRVRSLRLSGALPKLAAWVEVELHGQRRRQWLALHASVEAGSVRARGALVIKQSDYSLTPFSVAGGLLAVQDEMLIEFDLLARR